MIDGSAPWWKQAIALGSTALGIFGISNWAFHFMPPMTPFGYQVDAVILGTASLGIIMRALRVSDEFAEVV